jgi:Zn-dependent protease
MPFQGGSSTKEAPASFRLFGFPVHVRIGFFLFVGLVLVANSSAPEYAIWMAIFLTSLTLVHELGHAFAARATGAEAEIALDFLYGYAAFVPTRPLHRWERAGISFAGPGVQIGLSGCALLVIGVEPWNLDAVVDAGPAAQALWFAGPAIGVFNLIPVLPFDGGNIAMMAVDRVLPRQSRLVMTILSIALTASAMMALMVFADERFRSLAIFFALPLLSQLSMLTSVRAHEAIEQRIALHQAHIEREHPMWSTADTVWLTTDAPPGSFSPWLTAHIELSRGDRSAATQTLVCALKADPAHPLADLEPAGASPAQLERLVALLPDPLPRGAQGASRVLCDVLCTLGDYQRVGSYAAELFAAGRDPRYAVFTARAAAALGDRALADSWLSAARQAALADGSAVRAQVVNALVAGAPEFRRQPSAPTVEGT